MKKERIISLMLALTATAMTAQADVAIDATNFPDANFRNIVKGIVIDKNQDGVLSTAELEAVTTLAARSKEIESLKGVEHFYKLTSLNCENNRLSSLDVSKITTLKALYCGQNRLTDLDVSKNTALSKLYCFENKLTSLDVSKNTALTTLLCYDNKLTSLDLSNNKALTVLSCYLNQIGHSDMLALVRSLPTVTNGNFYGISISSSTEKNVLAKSRVEIAQGKGWSVKAKDGSSNVDYEGSEDPVIAINATNFPDENFRTIVAGTDIDKDANGKLSDEEIAAVTKLDVSEKSIASLKGIEFFTALTKLYCKFNKLTSLDVSKNTALQFLDCSVNQLTSLDVSKNTALISLGCDNNQLTSLDVSKNTALRFLYCYNNQLTSLDVSKNTALTLLECFNNQIKGDKMQALVNSLPTVTNGKFLVIDTKSSYEQNVCTKDQVAIAKGKGWTVYDNNGGSRQEYAGSEVTGIAIDATNFPDETFRAVVAETKIDKDADGYLSDEEIAAVTELGIMFENIASLKGIEFFTALTKLNCSGNQLMSLDVSKNTALEELYCYENQLTSLDVSKNTALTRLDCAGNQLASLDVSKNTALQNLDCSGNQLTSLDVSNNTKLESLSCGNNQLTSLDVSNNTALKDLWCWNIQLTSLDVSKNTALTELICFNNQIKGDKMQALVNSLPTVTEGYFYVIDTKSSNEQNVCTEPQVKIATGKGWTVCDYNGGTPEVLGQIAIDATNFPDEKFRTIVAGTDIDKDANGYLSDGEIAAVTQLTVSQKNIASLKGIEFFTALTELVCYVNQLTSLDVSKNTALQYLSCYGNYLTTLDVSKNTALTYLNCDGNELTSLDVSKNTALEYLNCWNNQLTSLDVSKNTALYYLDCSYNELTSLDVSKNTALKYLSCRYNELTTLDVSKNTALIKLHCEYNQLTSLDVSKNTALKDLSCPANQLTSLDVSKNTALEVLECNNNQLTSLDVNKNTALKELYCYNNELTTLDVSKNTALTALVCYGNQLTSLDVSKNTALQLLGCFGNQIKGEQMQALVNSLPTVTSGKFYVISTKSSYEQNVCTEPQVKIATDKGWTVYDYNGGSVQEYEGSVVTAIRSIEVSAEENGLWYTLDGKRLSGKPTQKGIYVRNGRKVVVK